MPQPQQLEVRPGDNLILVGTMKGAFLFGGKYGRGFASCRRVNGGWSSPGAVAIEGGSFGPQLGASSTDLIMLVMNQSGMKRLLGDKFTLGGEAAIVAGPTGGSASANTDVLMTAEMISYSRAKGLFVGLSLEGATLRPDGQSQATRLRFLMLEMPAPARPDRSGDSAVSLARRARPARR